MLKVPKHNKIFNSMKGFRDNCDLDLWASQIAKIGIVPDLIISAILQFILYISAVFSVSLTRLATEAIVSTSFNDSVNGVIANRPIAAKIYTQLTFFIKGTIGKSQVIMAEMWNEIEKNENR